jgi:methylthioribulose-1-phosphate dehydratase
MANDLNQLEHRAGLARAARDFHRRGWMAGTAGNMSVRVDADHFWLTASGKPKGVLDENDFVKMSLQGENVDSVVEGNRPSAECKIHEVIYQLFPDAAACLHVHSVDAYVATRRFANDSGKMLLPNIEMIKGFDIWEQEPNVELDVFDNHLDVSQIAKDIESLYANQSPQITALMIRDHGVTVWARDLQTAYNRVEIFEFIMSFMAKS